MPDEERPDTDDLELKLREIEEHGAELKRKVHSVAKETDFPEPPDWDYKRKPDQNAKRIKDNSQSYFQAGIGISVAYSLVGSIIFFWILGKVIDSRTGADGTWQGIMTMIGAVIGLTASIFVIIRAQNKNG
jgi:hypothetical protein